ncbi:MAG: hypothetical protein WCG35_03865 [Betaproteobacteria bacterium]
MMKRPNSRFFNEALKLPTLTSTIQVQFRTLLHLFSALISEI